MIVITWRPVSETGQSAAPRPATRGRLPVWWPLAALTLLAAVLRFATLDLQSFWYDEAFTPVHVLHASLGATLHGIVKTENTPPLGYVLIWVWSRIFGAGVVALRFPSALAGVATVPVAWEIGRELAGRARGSRRVAIVCAALVAVNPLFVWYSQEARAYGLYVFLSAGFAALYLFARRSCANARESRRVRARCGARARDFLLRGLHVDPDGCLAPARPSALADDASRGGGARTTGLGLVPLIVAQGGHGTQWISSWALSSRVQAIPQYYLTGTPARRSATASKR